jgi:hypothetical protein
MNVFVMQLLGIVFVTLIISSIQSVTADHLEPGKGLFKDTTVVNLTKTEDTNYRVYLQTVLRNGDGQLVGVMHGSTDGLRGWVTHHKVIDHVFDTLMGEKEIVTIDNIKYEKVQYTFTPTLEQRTIKYYPIFEEIPITYELDKNTLALMKELREYYSWKIHYCGTFEGHGYVCIPVFQNFAVVELVTPTDVVTLQWTILRVLN